MRRAGRWERQRRCFGGVSSWRIRGRLGAGALSVGLEVCSLILRRGMGRPVVNRVCLDG